MDFDGLSPDTLLQHYGEGQKIEGSVTPPLFQNSLFVFDSYDALYDAQVNKPAEAPHHYSRLSNPTLEVAERKIAMLEGTERCKLTGSGMAAISIAIMSCVEQGAHVVAVDTAYGPTRTFLNEYLPKFGVETTFVSGLDAEELIDQIGPETRVVYLESPSSLIFRLQDIEKIAKAAREKGVATIFDNTYSTPLYQQPMKMGVDIVVHSATKYLGGHSDLTAGAICADEERIKRIIAKELALFGSILAPFPAWLMIRALRTLPLRLKRHEESANQVAGWLEGLPQIERVNDVSLASFEQRDLYLRQMRGAIGLFSFEPKSQERERIVRFVDSLQVFQIGISWGGFESLVVPIHLQPLGYPEPRWVVRLYCGLEDPKDLIEDLRQGMEKAGL